jgi:hypothetical protein
MIRSYAIFVFIIVSTSFTIAQEVSYEKVKKLYETFEYQSFIINSDELLQKESLNDSLAIDIHLMRAIVFFTNGDDQSIRKSFESILKLRRSYIPDPANISPKLIPIFGEVKAEYIRNHPDQILPKDSTQAKPEIKYVDIHIMKSAIVQNILLPGLGQIKSGNKTKGWITTTASVINLGALAYFNFIDTKTKEEAYLQETDKLLIQQKYSDYNSSYKIRNVLIASYLVIWLYSQIDMLFFSNDFDSSQNIQSFNMTNIPFKENSIQLSIHVPF